MLLRNSELVLDRLSPSHVVLDIGGWAYPFNRANFVIDIEPYETRGHYARVNGRRKPLPPIGGSAEHFDKGTWIQRDLCSHEPYPFRDKEIDFVICSHVLENVRDPLWVCSEMIRIAKAGYIEVPSLHYESRLGAEGMAGLSRHRWLVTIEDDNLCFIPNYHRVYRRRSAAPEPLREVMDEGNSEAMFWRRSFDFYEVAFRDGNTVRESEKPARQVPANLKEVLPPGHWVHQTRPYVAKSRRKAWAGD